VATSRPVAIYVLPATAVHLGGSLRLPHGEFLFYYSVPNLGRFFQLQFIDDAGAVWKLGNLNFFGSGVWVDESATNAFRRFYRMERGPG
jgi:hypothetical protein